MSTLESKPMKVRMMLPISIRCSTCGSFISKGTKFNSRRVAVIGEPYLGIQASRFHFNCTQCSAKLIIKTDHPNFGYVVESGATPEAVEELADAIKSLENTTLDSKTEVKFHAKL